MKIHRIVSDKEEKQFEQFLEQNIKRYNNAQSPYFLKVRKPRFRLPLHIIIQDDDGDYLGGLTGTTYWDWLDIEDFYLPEALRGSGLGTEILTQAETVAVEHGCTGAFLTTYAFQARGFYEKQGYTVVGKLDDYPPGSAYYWMRKGLIPGG